MEKSTKIINNDAIKKTFVGYSVLEMLLSLMVVSILLNLCIPILNNVKILNEKEQYLYQDEIGIYQLQIRLAINKIEEVNPDEIIYYTTNGESTLSLVNNNLVSQPGWLCYLHDIDYAYFYEGLSIIYLEYERGDEYYSYPIAYIQKD